MRVLTVYEQGLLMEELSRSKEDLHSEYILVLLSVSDLEKFWDSGGRT